MKRLLAIAALFLFPSGATQAQTPGPKLQAGDVYQIERVINASDQGDNGMTGSSYDRDALIERVVAARDTGVELEYDLPAPTAQDRHIAWQFPARVFRSFDGSLHLLDASKLQVRADRWLKRAKLDRTACGHWAFTWTAVRVECDPQSVIAMIEALSFGPIDLREGAPYRSAYARTPAPLVRKTAGPGGATFTVDLAVDPGKIRQDRVTNDLIVAEIMHKTLTHDAALRAHSADDISGTISITFDVGPGGQMWRRTTVTKTMIKGPDGKVDNRIVTETLTRRLVRQRKS